MPRYRIIKPRPPVLEYRTTRYFLGEFAGMYSDWNWVARKDCEGYHVATLLRAASSEQLEEMRTTGFDVVAGTSADKIMQRPACGGRWWSELLEAC